MSPEIGHGRMRHDQPDAHPREPLEIPPLVAHGPPVVEIDFKWSPHRDPADDNESLAHDLGGRLMAKLPRKSARRQAQREKQKPDGEAHVSTLQQEAQLASFHLSAACEVVLDRALHFGGLLRARSSGQVYYQFEPATLWQFSRPTDDELLGIVIQIAIEEG